MSDAVTDLLGLADLATPMAVRVAATLRLADAIPATGASSAEITRAHARRGRPDARRAGQRRR